ncbi:hypothetical protein GE21DRAFT_1223543, partial [Neurospora crassa]
RRCQGRALGWVLDSVVDRTCSLRSADGKLMVSSSGGPAGNTAFILAILLNKGLRPVLVLVIVEMEGLIDSLRCSLLISSFLYSRVLL